MRVGQALLLVVILLFTSCSDWGKGEGSYQYFEMIPNGEWALYDELFFSTAVLNPDLRYNVRLVLRYDRDIKYLSLPLGLTFETPYRKLMTREVQIPLHCHHEGKGGFNIIEAETLLLEGVQFPHEGVYTYSVRHLSTDSIINGVVEVGLLIEPQ